MPLADAVSSVGQDEWWLCKCAFVLGSEFVSNFLASIFSFQCLRLGSLRLNAFTWVFNGVRDVQSVRSMRVRELADLILWDPTPCSDGTFQARPSWLDRPGRDARAEPSEPVALESCTLCRVRLSKFSLNGCVDGKSPKPRGFPHQSPTETHNEASWALSVDRQPCFP
jgi:hypothetical protein